MESNIDELLTEPVVEMDLNADYHRLDSSNILINQDNIERSEISSSEMQRSTFVNANKSDADEQVKKSKDLRLTRNNKLTTEDYIKILFTLAIKLRDNLTYTAALHVAKVLDVFTDTPSRACSKYYWMEICKEYSQDLSTHSTCIGCGGYLGISTKEHLKCDKCLLEMNCESSDGSFLYLSLTDQLRNIFETTDAHYLYSLHRKKFNNYAIEDIYDGNLYKKVMKNTTDTISLNFSVDGTPIFDSSNNSAYPVLCTINELSPADRKNHVLLASVWYGNSKPKNMNGYLTPFVNEAKKLYVEGFDYCYQDKKYNKKVIILMGICDSVARPLVRCSTQFNGEYGCGLCLNPGKEVEKGHGHTRVYLLEGTNAFGEGLRNHEETLTHTTIKEKGMKNKSVLCDLPNYDIINNLDADWMHCVALGVCRQFCNLWFSSSNKDQKFYFGSYLNAIDKLLLSYTPTIEISRTPRKMSDRVHWKAHEWVMFLLCYSLPTLKKFLPKKFLDHWALLVDGISILVQASILPSEIIYAEQCLINFIKGVSILYGEEHLSFNVHLLAHLPRSVKNWGPLDYHSAFLYEDLNQEIKLSVKSSNGVAVQITNSFRLKCTVDKLKILHDKNLTTKQRKCLNSILNRQTNPRPRLQVGDLGILGKYELSNELSRIMILALLRIYVVIQNNDFFYQYKRCSFNNKILHSTAYKRMSKRINCNVILDNGEIFEIQQFLTIKRASHFKHYLIGKFYQRSNKIFLRDRKLTHFIRIEKKLEDLAAVPIDKVRGKVIIIDMKQENYYLAYQHPCYHELLY